MDALKPIPILPNLNRVVLIVFFVALAGRLLFLALSGPQFGGDTSDYLNLANNILYFKSFSFDYPALTPTIRRAPMYPLFLAGLNFISSGHSYVFICFVQSVLDSIVAVIVLLTASWVMQLRLAYLAAGFYALNPALIANSSTILTESLFIFLLASAVFLISLSIKRQSVRLVVASGIALAFAILCRPIIIFLPLIFAVILLFTSKSSERRLHASVLLMSSFLFILPWTIRCSYYAGNFVTVQGLSTANFYLATLSDRSQTDEKSLWAYFFGSPEKLPEDPYGRMLATAKTSAEIVAADRYAFRQGITNIRNNPKRYLLSRLNSFPYLFLNSFDRLTGINKSFGELTTNKMFFLLFIKLTFLILFSALPFVLALIGLIPTANARAQPIAVLCASVWLFILFIHIPMWVEFRFWLPAIPFQLISASIGLSFIKERLFRG